VNSYIQYLILALSIAVSVLKGTIKDPNSPAAQRLKQLLLVLQAEIADFLTVYNQP
jgi:hypothetical protein